MSVPSIPLLLVIAVLGVYLLWKLMAPQKKKPAQRRFSVRKHRENKTGDDIDESEQGP